jgi:hypothetical protein
MVFREIREGIPTGLRDIALALFFFSQCELLIWFFSFVIHTLQSTTYTQLSRAYFSFSLLIVAMGKDGPTCITITY